MKFQQKVCAAFYGVAIGDGMGAPVEGKSPEEIKQLFAKHDFSTFLPPTHGEDPGQGKGYGRITDDTLMTEALLYAYEHAQKHMDSYDYATHMIPYIAEHSMFVPEWQCDMPILNRLAWPEKYPFFRLRIANAEPRIAGQGNCVNCGVAMYMLPIGVVNAGNPNGAYAEAAQFGSAHNESFALEAGAVMAAAYAAAFSSDATVDSVIKAACVLAKDGTSQALQATLAVAKQRLTLEAFLPALRQAILPFDPHVMHFADHLENQTVALADDGQPSRKNAIEEMPVALAIFAWAQGDFSKALEAGVRYGRDCDSIASMACGLCGALKGFENIPQDLIQQSDAINHRNFGMLGNRLVTVALHIAKQTKQSLQKHWEIFDC